MKLMHYTPKAKSDNAIYELTEIIHVHMPLQWVASSIGKFQTIRPSIVGARIEHH